MSPRFMLDADTVSYTVRGRGNAGMAILQQPRSHICLSAITVSELYAGAERLPSLRRAQIHAFADGIAVLPFDAAAAVAFGTLAAHLRKLGTPIGNFDTLVAAHALSVGATIVTNNVRHFSRVPNLAIENWL